MAGTSTIRTMVASMKTAAASPMPNILPKTSWPRTKERNTVTITAAPAVITRADLARPSATAERVVTGPVVLLLDPGQEEHLVVHREPEQDREDPDRQQDRDRCRLRDAHQVSERSTADRERENSKRRRAGEQVHDHRLERDHDGSEHHHQQQERDQQHAAEEERQPVRDAAGDCRGSTPPSHRLRP